MSNEYHYGKLDLHDAHHIAGGSNALLISLVVRKQRLARLHTRELPTRSDVTPEEMLKVIGIAQMMGGFPARWEAVHIHNVAAELHEQGLLPDPFVAVLERIPAPPA